MDWLTASEALTLLGTQPQTLYANVSRGRIKARPDPSDSRRSLYRGDDVRRLAQRAKGRRKQEAVAAQAMHWGDPVLSTAISSIADGRLLYRGHDARLLAETATLEDVAVLLWQAPLRLGVRGGTGRAPGLPAAFGALAEQAWLPTATMQAPAMLAMEAGQVLGTLAEALTGSDNAAEPLHRRLALIWNRPDAADTIRRALVLLADHELNASTFAARVAVSTGASLWAGTLAALSALTGPSHGRASRLVAALVEDVGGDPEALRDWLGEGRAVPGMGHPLYRHGDPRCAALLSAFDPPPDYVAFRHAATDFTGEQPNVDFALAALVARFDLPDDAALTVFTLGRCVGWLAHMIEQIDSGELIRPRARYVGAGPSQPTSRHPRA
ncbi:citrate/2-methylcitrate synthase [Devosia ginsengisoli]|uniref:citrate synthase (unknown stereospecificity) n=1 Tax=Devosia ginsengisoli TaxID=400770 RepID=A0A5B8M0H4_9HYPH|nr:citrate synthase [Devosia ginsengisoli]QDZ13202.1 citrate synthase [Devosia ginsengisoli]